MIKKIKVVNTFHPIKEYSQRLRVTMINEVLEEYLGIKNVFGDYKVDCIKNGKVILAKSEVEK